MKTAEIFLGNLADVLWGNWMLYVLLGIGLFYTVTTKGIQIRSLPWLARGLRGRAESGTKEGTVSPVQALYVAIASCVGSGNIVGVATALIGGGPGALFWMWAAALLGMATKYAEIVLGLRFREQDADGRYFGGPMYYIGKGLKLPWLGAVAAVLLFLQNAGATLIQANTLSDVALYMFRIPKPATGFMIAAVMLFIIRGGLTRLAGTAQKIVPFMSALYIIGGVIVVIANREALMPMLKSIIQGAFSLSAGGGAIAGMTMKEAMRFGVARGLYSNEAGEGSAAVIHSAARTESPVKQGFLGVVEVFVDTIVICSTTGFAILISGVPLQGGMAASLAAEAFGTVLPALKYMVSGSLILFAGTSIMSQWYFGHVSLKYLQSQTGDKLYQILFPVLIITGSLSTADIVWSIQDCALGLLIIPNIIALLMLAPIVVNETRDFFKQTRRM